ncbi:uncharacterized protein LOC134668930 [Cydia fagiglandana]|uniref:uncharacterized protein LOC134668930 n=1 Tax=Cydia fagiglandana TaxID=1458189 RepID=UPI002FEE466D
MAKEDISLPVEMGKLEIQPVKSINNTDANPFFHSQPQQRRHLLPRSTQTLRCHCSAQRNKSSMSICKKKNNNKILKKPVLKLLQNYCKDTEESHNCCSYPNKIATPLIEGVNSENSVLCALVQNCNQLRISSERDNAAIASSSNDTKWWKKELPCSSIQSRESVTDKGRAGPSCSQEALNPPCDVTIDELASYFETFVHIPKKMSSMAEMMYI